MSYTFTIDTLTTNGTPLSIDVTLDQGDFNLDGKQDLTITLDTNGYGDLRGFFFDVSDNSLLASLLVSGADITQSEFDGSVETLGGGNTVNGDPAAPYEGGIEIGTSGAGQGDFISSYETLVGELIALRATSVDDAGTVTIEDGSSKLGGVVPPPPDSEPEPEPEVCFDGFSHGYWKTHQDLWDSGDESPYVASASFETTFGITAHGAWYNPGSKGTTTLVGQDVTLGKALALQGGGENALAREAVAALENSSAGDLLEDAQFAFATQDIINAVKWVYGYNVDLDGDNVLELNNATDGVYNATTGGQLQVLLEQWNTVHDNIAYDPEHGFCLPESEAPGSIASTLGWITQA
jgi:hypothetical protein